MTRVAYVDTSCLVAVTLEEPAYLPLAKKMQTCSMLLSSTLLEAEFFATLARAKIPLPKEDLLAHVSWVLPNRRLTPEIRQVLSVGSLRGADLWHVACALYVAREPHELIFLTLNKQQLAVAQALGFRHV